MAASGPWLKRRPPPALVGVNLPAAPPLRQSRFGAPRAAAGGSGSFPVLEQRRQPRDVHRDAAHFVIREHVGLRRLGFVRPAVDVRPAPDRSRRARRIRRVSFRHAKGGGKRRVVIRRSLQPAAACRSMPAATCRAPRPARRCAGPLRWCHRPRRGLPARPTVASGPRIKHATPARRSAAPPAARNRVTCLPASAIEARPAAPVTKLGGSLWPRLCGNAL
jgi:hypothetical protein